MWMIKLFNVIDDDVKNVIDDVVKTDVSAWFNITANNDIVKDAFEDDELDVLWFWVIDVTDAKSEMKLDVDADVKISDVIFDFLIWCSSICLWNWVLLKYLAEQRLHAKISATTRSLIIRIFSFFFLFSTTIFSFHRRWIF